MSNSTLRRRNSPLAAAVGVVILSTALLVIDVTTDVLNGAGKLSRRIQKKWRQLTNDD